KGEVPPSGDLRNKAAAMSFDDDQVDVFPTRLALRPIDPARNMRRFYLVQLQSDLFSGTSLIREWGRIGRGSCFPTGVSAIEKAMI
ncbi:WGR domain-containing protein, partial [Palleronia aestuarii]